MIKLNFNKNYSKWFVNKVIWAIKNYSMIYPDDTIGVALSGGKDSSVLLYILWYINRYSYLKFKLHAFHAKVADYEIKTLQDYCYKLEVPLEIIPLPLKYEKMKESKCSICSRFVKGAIIKSCKKFNIKKLAFGHSATDVTETFFMNIFIHKKLGTFHPKIELKREDITLVRPLIYLKEKKIEKIANYVGLNILKYKCPYSKENIRCFFKKNVQNLNKNFKVNNIEDFIIPSIENIDWTNIWRKNEKIY